LAIWSADFVRNRNRRLRRNMVNLEKESRGYHLVNNPYYRENPRVCQAIFSEVFLYLLLLPPL
jgi:hypothetical protein